MHVQFRAFLGLASDCNPLCLHSLNAGRLRKHLHDSARHGMDNLGPSYGHAVLGDSLGAANLL